MAVSEDSADITGLSANVYLFQVVAMATFGGQDITGNRSVVDNNSLFTIFTRAGRGETRTRGDVITPAVPTLRKHIVLLVLKLKVCMAYFQITSTIFCGLLMLW